MAVHRYGSGQANPNVSNWNIDDIVEVAVNQTYTPSSFPGISGSELVLKPGMIFRPFGAAYSEALISGSWSTNAAVISGVSFRCQGTTTKGSTIDGNTVDADGNVMQRRGGAGGAIGLQLRNMPASAIDGWIKPAGHNVTIRHVDMRNLSRSGAAYRGIQIPHANRFDNLKVQFCFIDGESGPGGDCIYAVATNRDGTPIGQGIEISDCMVINPGTDKGDCFQIDRYNNCKVQRNKMGGHFSDKGIGFFHPWDTLNSGSLSELVSDNIIEDNEFYCDSGSSMFYGVGFAYRHAIIRRNTFRRTASAPASGVFDGNVAALRIYADSSEWGGPYYDMQAYDNFVEGNWCYGITVETYSSTSITKDPENSANGSGAHIYNNTFKDINGTFYLKNGTAFSARWGNVSGAGAKASGSILIENNIAENCGNSDTPSGSSSWYSSNWQSATAGDALLDQHGRAQNPSATSDGVQNITQTGPVEPVYIITEGGLFRPPERYGCLIVRNFSGSQMYSDDSKVHIVLDPIVDYATPRELLEIEQDGTPDQVAFGDFVDALEPDVGQDLRVGTPITVQIKLANLANGAYRQSAKFDFGEKRAAAYSIRAVLGFNSSVNGSVELFLAPSSHSTAIGLRAGNPGNATGQDADYTGYSGNNATDTAKQLMYLGTLNVAGSA